MNETNIAIFVSLFSLGFSILNLFILSKFLDQHKFVFKHLVDNQELVNKIVQAEILASDNLNRLTDRLIALEQVVQKGGGKS